VILLCALCMACTRQQHPHVARADDATVDATVTQCAELRDREERLLRSAGPDRSYYASVSSFKHLVCQLFGPRNKD
jgi:hypothetical protein